MQFDLYAVIDKFNFDTKRTMSDDERVADKKSDHELPIYLSNNDESLWGREWWKKKVN